MIPRASCSRKIINNSHLICPRGEMLIFYSERLPAHHNIQGYLPQSCFPVKACLLFPPPSVFFSSCVCRLISVLSANTHPLQPVVRLFCLFACLKAADVRFAGQMQPPTIHLATQISSLCSGSFFVPLLHKCTIMASM